MAQLVKCLILDLSSGLDLRVVSSSPMLGVEPTLKKRKTKYKLSSLNNWKDGVVFSAFWVWLFHQSI